MFAAKFPPIRRRRPRIIQPKMGWFEELFHHAGLAMKHGFIAGAMLLATAAPALALWALWPII